jgi:hypothetical protein
MHRLLVGCSALLLGALLLCASPQPASAGFWGDAQPVDDCRQPAPYSGVTIQARQLRWRGSRLTITFVLRNDSPEAVIVNGPAPDGLIMTEFELISPEGPRYYADWHTIRGVFRREGFPPLAPGAVAQSTIVFDAQRRPYTLHFHRILTFGGTKIRRSAFVCIVPVH